MTGNKNVLLRNKAIIAYGITLALLLILLKWLELRLLIFNNAFEIYAASIAILFMLLGIWVALKLAKPKIQTVIVEKPVYMQTHEDFRPDEEEIKKLGLSKREMEVLQLMADGLSNLEIAGKLFLSENTVKTHSSRVFEKLDVKRRTQAVEKARRLIIIP
jgi:ATP/maltotriose-dependent transcriptional regulator MalT